MSQFKNTLIAALLLCVFSSFSVFASEELNIQNDSSSRFTGSFKAGDHLILFDTKAFEQQVSLNIEIDGEVRTAIYDIDKTFLQLTDGTANVTETEKELMYDTVKTLVDYVNHRSEDNLSDNFVILVGVLNRWSGQGTIR